MIYCKVANKIVEKRTITNVRPLSCKDNKKKHAKVNKDEQN